MHKTNIEAIYPLSPLQRGILFHSIYDPESKQSYVVQLNCDLRGHLDVDAFKAAWRKVLERHSSLRTLFTWEDRDEPLQIVCAHLELPWTDVDWRDLTLEERNERFRAFLASDLKRGFDLSKPPLMRIALIRLSESLHRFIWTKHHLIIDGWSSMAIMGEILTLYEAYRCGRQPVLPPAQPYGNYISWLKGQNRAAAELFWRATLKGFSSPTPLPITTTSSTVGNSMVSDSELHCHLSASLTKALQSVARTHGITLNTFVLAAWILLLNHCTGEGDVVVGATVAGRPAELPGMESMVGLFINTLPIRKSISGGVLLLSWLQSLQSQQVSIRQYEYSSLVDIQAWSEITRGVPLFNTYVVFENYPARRYSEALADASGNVEIGKVQTNERPNYPLLLVAIPGQQLELRLLYSSALYDNIAGTRILKHLQAVFESMVSNLDRPLAAISCLSRGERHQSLVEWNDSEQNFASSAPLPKQIEAQALCRPDAVAVRFGEGSLSYRELNSRANRLANYLQQSGAGSEVRVGVCLERSIEMVIALLAIVKTGSAYVPLDPDYPGDRLAQIIEDSGTAIVLTNMQLRECLPHSSALEICLDAEAEKIAKQRDVAPTVDLLPEGLIYVLYTSGSTGKPKGVAITNASLVHHMNWMIQEFAFTENDHFLQKTPFSFDASVWEFWAPLMCGGQLTMARPRAQSDGEYLVHAVQEHEITVLQLVPTQLRLMLAAGGLESCHTLGRVFCGGEMLDRQLQEEACNHLHCELCNLYGPTEATIDTNFERCHAVTLPSAPIGRPIANTKCYLLTAEYEPVPIGVNAQLFIAGAGLARCYWDNPELTARSFIPDPFSGNGARMYRTGDLAKYLNDGTLLYTGRTDHQVKVRGFRIEPGEIESLLLRHHAVAEAVVLCREDEPGTKRLVAYVVTHDRTFTSNELLSYLRERLPEYMHPAACVVLEAMPLTLNGKVDRAALPKPEITSPGKKYAAPRNPLEQLLCRIWAEALRLEQVGINDNFFELGGDSILCIQIVSRVRQAGYNIAPIDLFENQTIAKLGTVLSYDSDVGSSPKSMQGAVPLSPIQQRFFDSHLINPNQVNQAVLLSMRQPVDANTIEDAVHALVEQHESLRFRFTAELDTWRQITAGSADRMVLTIDVSNLPPLEQDQALHRVADDLHRSLDVSDGPLARFALFRITDQVNKLLIVIHHLVIDAVSWRIVLEDLETAYQQVRSGKPTQLLAPKTSFREWVEHLRNYRETEAFRHEAQYWLKPDWEGVQAGLPLDMPSGTNSVESVRTISDRLTREETDVLLREIPAATDSRITEILLAALVQAHCFWTGQRSLLLDVEAHGRETLVAGIDLSRTVGWFTSVFPVQLQLNGERHEVLNDIKAQFRAIPRNGLPYGVLRYLSPDSDTRERLNRIAQPQISFNYLGQFDQLFSASSMFESGRENFGRVQAGGNHRRHLINFEALILNAQLGVNVSYSENIHLRETIVRLTDLFMTSLRSLIGTHRRLTFKRYTPSDFPLANLDQEGLDRVLSSGMSVEDIYSLSPMQQGLLFHSVYAQAAGMYFVQISCRIRGPLDVPCLRRAWQTIIDRHSVLRTSFVWKDLSEPLQIVHSGVSLPWCEEDWSDLSACEQSERLRKYVAQDRECGFELNVPPLMRLALFRTGPDSYFFVWSSHHLLYDAWCRELIVKELFTYYESYLQRRERKLPAPPRYRDYISWLRLQSRSKAEAFWRKQLEGFSSPIHLGCDRGRPTVHASPNHEQNAVLDLDDTARLVQLAKSHQLSLNTIVLCAWLLVLSAHSGETDIVVGTTVSGRSAPIGGIESMVGLFINTIPVRMRLQAEESLTSLLKRLQLWQGKSVQYELTPIMDVQAWSEVAHGTPLFQYLFLFQNYPAHGGIRERAHAWLQISDVESQESANYPLVLVCEPGPRLHLRAAYDDKRFSPSSIARLLSHLREVLARMVTDFERHVGDITPLIESERHRLLIENSDSECTYDASLLVHEMVDAQVERNPDAIAVVSEEAHVSYRMLKRRSDHVAHHLGSLGIGPETLVGICIEKSADLLVGLLGILKAGAAYVPLDVNHPTERIAYMLEDSEARVVLTEKSLCSKLSSFAAKIVFVDDDCMRLIPGEGAKPLPQVTAQNLAYAIYTSGSTGKPKGVAISHGALGNYIRWARDAYLREEQMSFPLYSSLAFDLTVTSLYTPLTVGGLVEVHRETLLNQLVRETQAEVLKLTPSHLMMIKDQDNRQSVLRRLIVGGEALETSLAEAIHRSFGGVVEIYNEYGPTEATVGCMIERWNAGLERGKTVGIGRPAANSSILILDRNMQPVVESVRGELHIGGAGLARGYLRRPDLTAEKFVPDPFSREPGARLYKSGDLARYRADGSLDFLGRIDEQIKVRGVRIEPAEVEAALLENEAVRNAKITTQKDESGAVQLVAYLDLKEATGFSADGMRRFLAKKLPDCMIPNAFVAVGSLPTSANGKIDLRTLKAMPECRPKLQTSYVAPRANLEQQIADMWQKVLHLDKIGVHDNFFDLGGHSILLMQLHGHLEALLKQRIPILELFEYPTVGSLAAHLAQKAETRVSLWSADDSFEKRAKVQDRLKMALRQRTEALSGMKELRHE